MSDLTGTVRVQCRHGACFTLMRWKKEFKSQNEFVICAINDYYERHLRKKA